MEVTKWKSLFLFRVGMALLGTLAGAVACSDNSTPTAPTNDAPNLAPARPTQTGPLNFVFTAANPAVISGLNTVGTFVGTVTITRFATDAAGNLIAIGTATGTAVINGVTTTFINTAFSSIVTPLQQRCPILQLDIGRIFLDLLGLQVDIAPISVDITAVAGPGNLLGNLLCALVHILDQNPLAALVGQLLAQINAILGAL
jgi:hypothetical protein